MKWIFGPESLWIALYFMARMLAKMNLPPLHRFDPFLENLFLWVPLAVLLTFSLWHFPSVDKNWLLLRVWLVCLIGGHLVLAAGLEGHSQQGPGIGMAYIMGLGTVFVALVMGSIYVKIRF